jgi:ABC-type multidrug transport system fused ATPase/permease subunit
MPRLIATNLTKEEFIKMKIVPVTSSIEKETEKNNKKKQSWEDKASWLNFLFLGYLTPLLKKGADQNLTMDDVGWIQSSEEAESSFRQFMKLWEIEVAASTDKKPPSVMRVQLQMIGLPRLAVALGYYGLYSVLQFFPVAMLNILVQHFSGTGFNTLTTPLLLFMVIGLLIVPIIGSVFQTRHDVLMSKYGLRCRTAASVAIYRHALNLTSAARQGVTTGEIVNLFSNDALKVEMFMKFMSYLVVAPLQVALCLYLIYTQVGNAMFVGIGFMMFLVPLQGLVFGTMFKYQKIFLKKVDRKCLFLFSFLLLLFFFFFFFLSLDTVL